MAQTRRFTYRDYVSRVMMAGGSLDSLADHLRPFVAYFADCRHVVDLGSGSGMFLKLLREAGIAAPGVDNDPELAVQLTAAGYNVVLGEAPTIWAHTRLDFDG